jgi:hypothetical protein
MVELPPQDREGRAPSLPEALSHLLEASQRMVIARIDLLRLEAREDVASAASAATVILLGGVLLLSLFGILEALLVQGLHQYLSLLASLGSAAMLNAFLGGILVAIGLRWLKSIRVLSPDRGPDYQGSALSLGEIHGGDNRHGHQH